MHKVGDTKTEDYEPQPKGTVESTDYQGSINGKKVNMTVKVDADNGEFRQADINYNPKEEISLNLNGRNLNINVEKVSVYNLKHNVTGEFAGTVVRFEPDIEDQGRNFNEILLNSNGQVIMTRNNIPENPPPYGSYGGFEKI